MAASKRSGQGSGTHLFQKGAPGRPKGAKDRVPGLRKQRASIRRFIAKLVQQHPKSVTRAVRRGLMSEDPRTAFPYIQLATFMLDGKPVESIKMKFHEDSGQDSHDWSKLSIDEQRVLLTLLQKAKADTADASTQDSDADENGA